MEKLHIVTVATNAVNYFPYLMQSCERNGKIIEVLGMGEKWEGFNFKYIKIIEYLKGLPTDDIVCFVDGYDVICCRNLNEMVDEFIKIKERTGCKLVVGDDKIYPFGFLLNLYFGECNNNHINSGTYIGYVSDVLEIIQKIYDMDPRAIADDQVMMIKYCNQNMNDIYCDTENKIFLTIGYAFNEIHEFVVIDENTKELSYNSNQPFFLHAPGYGNLDNIIYKLGYDIEVGKLKNQLFWNSSEKVLLIFKNFFLQNYLIIFLLIILLIYFLFYLKKKKIYKLFYSFQVKS